MSEQLIVAVDGSASSAAAVAWVIARTQTRRASVEVLTVVELDPARGGSRARSVAAGAVAEAAATRIEAAGSIVRCATTVQHGGLLHGLLSASRRSDLLVVGAEPPTRPTDAQRASLRVRLAEHSLVPVVAVPTGWRARRGPIVLGVDEDDGLPALAFAVREASRDHALLLAARDGTISVLATAADLVAAAGRAGAGSTSAALDEEDGERAEDAAPLVHADAALAERARIARLVVIGTHPCRTDGRPVLRADGRELLERMLGPVAAVPQVAAVGTSLAAVGRPTAFSARRTDGERL